MDDSRSLKQLGSGPGQRSRKPLGAPGEWLARGLVLGAVLGLVLLIAVARWRDQTRVVEIRGWMSESGGWQPGNLTAKAGEPLRLRLVAQDVVHGFAVGQQDWPALDLHPGQPVETELVFDQPGRYIFYCTRWCGLNHWRMRGVIEVQGETSAAQTAPEPPLFVTLGINLDAAHPAANLPARKPQAAPEDSIPTPHIPARFLDRQYYQAHSPDQAFAELRLESSLAALENDQIWDLVATLWRRQAGPQALQEGARLYAANCAACHGELGKGDGVMSEALIASGQAPAQPGHEKTASTAGHEGTPQHTPATIGHRATSPTDFTDAASMLGASPALLHGKIVRGGMGTGMPYWGPIFTDAQIWSLVAYLWTFQFAYP